MFVLKEKLINSILIKVKGEGCVLYSCWIPLPLKKGGGKKKRNPSGVCESLSIAPSAYHLHLVPMGWQCLAAGSRLLGRVQPGMAAQIFPHALWI